MGRGYDQKVPLVYCTKTSSLFWAVFVVYFACIFAHVSKCSFNTMSPASRQRSSSALKFPFDPLYCSHCIIISVTLKCNGHTIQLFTNQYLKSFALLVERHAEWLLGALEPRQLWWRRQVAIANHRQPVNPAAGSPLVLIRGQWRSYCASVWPRACTTARTRHPGVTNWVYP